MIMEKVFESDGIRQGKQATIGFFTVTNNKKS